ncbi:UNVERIFIED_CONTAM: hypothetical protein Slati_4547600, partial [Sesamum latifolium]
MLRKARGTGLYQKREGDKAKDTRAVSPERSLREGAKQASGSKGENNDIPRKGVIRMIAGGPSGGNSHQKPWKTHPSFNSGGLNRGPRTSHNDALVITAILANYEMGRIFIGFGSSADILFGEAYDQMQLGDVSLEKVTPRLDVPSAYNVILGRPTLNTFQAVISTYHMKIKFPTPGGVGEVQGDHLQSRKCYADAVRKGQKRKSNKIHRGVPPNKKGKEAVAEGAPEEAEAPAKVQPAEELLNIEIRNADIFAWALQDLEGIDPKVITHHLNIDPSIKPVKQKKRHFGPEKDKIIQEEVDKLMAAGHIEEIQFPEWLSNVVLVPILEENGECVLISGILI